MRILILLAFAPIMAQAAPATIKCSTSTQQDNGRGQIRNSIRDIYYVFNEDEKSLSVFDQQKRELVQPCSKQCRITITPNWIEYHETYSLSRDHLTQNDFQINRVSGELKHTQHIAMTGYEVKVQASGTCVPAELPPLAPPKF